MPSTTASGKRKDHNHTGRGDGVTQASSSIYHGAGVGTSVAVKDTSSTQQNAYEDPSSSSDDDSPDVIAMKNEIMGRFVPRGPGSEPVKGAPRRPTGSRRDQHQHRQLPPSSSARGPNIPPKGHTPATTATQPTTAGSGKRRPS